MNKLTFRRFLEDIMVGDAVFDPEESDMTAQQHDSSVKSQLLKQKNKLNNDGTWRKSNIKFPIPGFEVVFSKTKSTIALLDRRDLSKEKLPAGFGNLPKDKNRVAVAVKVAPRVVKVPGATVKGVSTDLLSARKEYQGGGLAPKFYAALVRGGQTLFSSDNQTEGGMRTWQKVVKELGQDCEVFVYVPASEVGGTFYNYGPKASDRSMHELFKLIVGKEPATRRELEDFIGNEFSHTEIVNKKPKLFSLEEAGFEGVLAYGNIKRLDSIAYSEEYPVWLVMSKSAGQIEQLKKYAVKL